MNEILTGDCLEHLPRLPAGCVDLAFADPPFNIGYGYDVYDDSKPKTVYLDWAARWLREIRRVLKGDGSFWLAIGDEYAAELKVLAGELGFSWRSWVIWYYTFGVNLPKNFSRSHTHLLYFVADARRFVFDADAVKVPSARQVMGDKRAKAGGRIPDNTWILRPQQIEAEGGMPGSHDVWHIPRVCGTFNERGDHPCQMPEAVLERIVRVSSRPGDLVLDPFCGSGTTPAVARKLGRKCLGIELSEKYAEAVRIRLSLLDAPVAPVAPPAASSGVRAPGNSACGIAE